MDSYVESYTSDITIHIYYFDTHLLFYTFTISYTTSYRYNSSVNHICNDTSITATNSKTNPSTKNNAIHFCQIAGLRDEANVRHVAARGSEESVAYAVCVDLSVP
jgi:uncharacterized membrane protein